MSLFEIVIVSLGFELAIIWVIREQTQLVKRVRLMRLWQVGGVATLMTAALGWAIALDVRDALGLPLTSAVTFAAVAAGEAVLYRKIGRLRWKQAWIFACVANAVAWAGVLALLLLTGSGE